MGDGGPRGEAFFEALANGSTDGLLLADDDSIVLWANPAAARLIGGSAEALVGRRTLDLQHPDDADLSLARRARFETMADDERPRIWHGTRRIKRDDGSYRL